jgi:hypothetical protein
MVWKILKPLAFALAAVGFFAAGAVACSDDDDDAGAQDSSTTRIDRLEVLAAISAMRADELHALDEDSQEADEIEEGWSGRAERMLQVVKGTTWPQAFVEDGGALQAELQALSDAIEAEDLEGVKEHSAAAHEVWHELEHDAYAFIGGEEHSEEEEGGEDTGTEDGGQDDDGEESPAG